MSNMNRIVPLLLATGVGIYNGIYVFDPAFKEQKEQREKTFAKQHQDPEAAESQGSAIQDAGAETLIADPAGGQKEVAASSQKSLSSKDASGSSFWPKGWGLAWPGSKASSEAEQPKHDASNHSD